MDIEELKKQIKNKLSEKRYYHCLCVMERCEELAKKFNVDIETAQKVGLCHDIAKEFTEEEINNYIEKNNIEIDEIEKENMGLLHAKIGADLVIKEYGFTKEMGEAIKAHTTGLPNMDTLAKILFIADRTSKERGFTDLDMVEELLNKNIDEAILYILDKKIELQLKRKKTMHWNSIITRNKILKNIN